jgi:hypothetical protein
MKIDNLFEKYPENIIGFRVNKTTKIIDVWLSNEWELPTNESKLFAIKKQKDDEANNKSYYIIFSDTSDFEGLYQSLTKIIEHNLDIERKQKLFSSKMNELKKLFTTLSYEELKEIQFDTPLALTGASIDDVVDVTEKPKKEATPKPSKRQVENVDKSEELMSPEVMEHDVNVDEDEDVDNIKPVELKQV